jgi:hypothetical protein
VQVKPFFYGKKMARARNIKPSLFTNEVLGTLDPFISMTFVGLWCLADRTGRLEDRPLRIKAELFPYREGLNVNGYLTDLQRFGFIDRYEVDGKKYIQVLKFEKHQSPHHTEKQKGYPEKPASNGDSGYLTVMEPLQNIKQKVSERSDSLIPDSLIPDSLIDKQAAKAAPLKKSDRKIFMPEDFGVSERVQQWADKNGFNRLDEHLESLKRKAAANGYKKISWDDFFMEAIREDWAKLRTSTSQQKQQKTFAERDREAGMARWEEMTGRVHPDRQKTQTGQIIDVTPSLLEIGQ